MTELWQRLDPFQLVIVNQTQTCQTRARYVICSQFIDFVSASASYVAAYIAHWRAQREAQFGAQANFYEVISHSQLGQAGQNHVGVVATFFWQPMFRLHDCGDPPDPPIFQSILDRPLNAWDILRLDRPTNLAANAVQHFPTFPVSPPELIELDAPTGQ